MKKRNHKISQTYCGLRIRLCLGTAVLAAGVMGAALQPAAVYAEDYTDVFYKGEAEGKVNVRVAPGQDNEQVTHGGEKVQLKAGDVVTIIGEEMVGDKVWYKVHFMIGSDEIIGYSTSSYIKKTSVQITPTPTPTPEPTPSPTPEPTKEPEPTEEVTPSAVPEEKPEEEEKSGGKGGIIAAVIVILLAGGALVFLKSRKAQAAGKAASRKMAQLKKMKLESGDNEEEDNSRGRRKPEVKTKVNYRETQADQVYQDVYLKKGASGNENQENPEYAYIDQGDSEEIKANAARENEERRALREEIENLREHDLVIHKYFGKGEVFDNSDVRLIEVRFGGEARFMNKDALAAKKLMKRCSEDTMRYHRRASDRQPRDEYFDE